MKIDNVIYRIIEKISKKRNVDITKVGKTLEGFYKGVTHIIENEQTVIKIDYFGKFAYSEAWKAKKEQIRRDFKELQIIE